MLFEEFSEVSADDGRCNGQRAVSQGRGRIRSKQTSDQKTVSCSKITYYFRLSS
ncbi:hypothetical protein [Chlorogloeopsis fritschii]|uniref:hypothetical protein n=1 Tax=Chlorogloeopsis fritschii TaxID=1124 RepID=UPI000312C914|nr:hypothetical protein [Chlorogloeopsis fritschii]